MVDTIARNGEASFEVARHGEVSTVRFKGILVLLKPSTFMNLSGAVRYWMDAEKIPLERVLIITDDLAPRSARCACAPGSGGGHNGLGNIETILNTSKYPRLRFGIGADFHKGQQVDYVLGSDAEESDALTERLERWAVQSFASIGLERTMNHFNNT